MKRIIVDDISKKFKIGFKKHQIGLAKAISLFSGKEPLREIEALKNVSFTVEAGEMVGIIGKNGSGKSTLLRTIAGIYQVDKGEIKTNGNLVSVSSLGEGLKSRLTMEDNIYLCCSFFGLTKKETKKKFQSIVEFTELENFVNTKLFQFSKGMTQRLAVSIIIHSNPQILLIDESSESIDYGFNYKITDEIKKIANAGGIILTASHTLKNIESFDRVIWLDKGKIIKQGDPKKVIDDYLNFDI